MQASFAGSSGFAIHVRQSGGCGKRILFGIWYVPNKPTEVVPVSRKISVRQMAQFRLRVIKEAEKLGNVSAAARLYRFPIGPFALPFCLSVSAYADSWYDSAWGGTMIIAIPTLVALVLVAGYYGARRWRLGTTELRSRIESARQPVETRVFDTAELEGLPAPVQRYFRMALREGQPVVTAVNVKHTGTFNMSETGEQWKPFTSDQRVVTHRPGFDWDARVKVVPGMPVYVHDSYVAGEGILHAAVRGLVSVADLRGTGEVARGELMRFFAEAVWYPTALLPSQGVAWHGVDDRSANAMLTDGNITLTLLFGFGEDGLIETVCAESRGRTVGNRVMPTPWQGRFWSYATRDGMLIPLDGEVAWLLPEGRHPYWRGHINEISYEFA